MNVRGLFFIKEMFQLLAWLSVLCTDMCVAIDALNLFVKCYIKIALRHV